MTEKLIEAVREIDKKIAYILDADWYDDDPKIDVEFDSLMEERRRITGYLKTIGALPEELEERSVKPIFVSPKES